MEEKLNITAANGGQIVNLDRKLGLTSACQRRPLLSVPCQGPTSLPRHGFFQGVFSHVATVAIMDTFWKKTAWQDTDIVCKSVYCLPPPPSLTKKPPKTPHDKWPLGSTEELSSNKQHQHVCLSQISNSSLKCWEFLLRV